MRTFPRTILISMLSLLQWRVDTILFEPLKDVLSNMRCDVKPHFIGLNLVV